jgi:hypothetical protein
VRFRILDDLAVKEHKAAPLKTRHYLIGKKS